MPLAPRAFGVAASESPASERRDLTPAYRLEPVAWNSPAARLTAPALCRSSRRAASSAVLAELQDHGSS
ncbi:protein of unknown function [Paraburkholderia dioscoreae]|uniref:Uncharacterized protein n=1 Tax=Paraburkholderia dioscoreae TaxID=2604047 RepID=A0A5Q4ZPT3_9BURK|nr:protein of unknown function [Paraburkholderia dioscoreae]